MAVITETAPAQSLASTSIGKLKLNGSVSANGHDSKHVNGKASASAPAEKESKLVDPFNYVVS